ncbi:MAG: SEC-C metal-binding domain-containing protein, partial [Actinomycetota bacterium]
SGCVNVSELVVAVLAADPDALRAPAEPLSVILDAAGLEVRGEHAGRAGSEWLTPAERFHRMRREMNEQVYGFSDCCHDAFAVVEDAFRAGVDDTRQVTAALAHDRVAEAFARHEMSFAGPHSRRAADMLDEFAQDLLEEARGSDAAAVWYVRALALEGLGRAVEAEAAARSALRADAAHQGALEELATYAEERGDAAAALDLLRRAGVPGGDPQSVRLATITAAATVPKVGRNDPCPCGSGRKFKACCLDRPRLDEDLRFAWLLTRAVEYVRGPGRRDRVAHLAAHALGAAGSDAHPMERGMADPRLHELALFDEGMIDGYLAERGPLLPAADRDLAESWAGCRLALLEALDAPQDGRLRVRDTGGGDELTLLVGDETECAAGDFLLGHVLPHGDALRLAPAWVRVPVELRDAAREMAGGDTAACDWAEWFGSAEAPAAAELDPEE